MNIMRRKTLAILTLIALGLFFVSIGIYAMMPGASIYYCASPNNCPPASIPGSISVSPLSIGLIVFIIGQVSLLAAVVLQIIAWMGAMTRQAKRQQWIWFVCTLFFSPICLWLYLLTPPEAPKPISMPPEQPIYQPYTQGDGAPHSVHTQPEVYQEGRQQYQYLEQQQHQWQYEEPIVMYPQE